MNYWVYKCNTQGAAVGNKQWGDWEGKDAFGRNGAFSWGSVDEIPDLGRPKKGDRVIAHQTDRHKLVGVAEVLGLRNGHFGLRPLERIGADMRELKKRHKEIARIPAYRGGPIQSIYDIDRSDAETLLRIARASVGPLPLKTGGKARERLADALDELAAAEEAHSASGPKNKLAKRATQGFGLTPTERRAVERRAVDLATGHFESGGWIVDDVGNRESFDLRCRRKGVELHVEVKGTTGLGMKVILPKNEVHHAQSYKHVALAIAHGVSLKKGKVPKATGGELRVMHPWKIVDKDLEPLAYYYKMRPA